MPEEENYYNVFLYIHDLVQASSPQEAAKILLSEIEKEDLRIEVDGEEILCDTK